MNNSSEPGRKLWALKHTGKEWDGKEAFVNAIEPGMLFYDDLDEAKEQAQWMKDSWGVDCVPFQIR